MAFYTGTGSRLQIGKEASFAQAASPTTLVDLTSESIKVAVEKGDEGSLLGSKTASSRDLLAVTVEGSVSFILRPESAGLILHATLGGDDTCSQVGDSDSYTHTMGLCDVNEALPSLTIAVDRKAAIKRYVGCTISALSLDCAAGDYVKGSIDLKGTTEESGTIDEALKSFSIPSYRCTNATFTVNGSTYDITSASLKIDNTLESSPRTYASGLYAGQPQHGKRVVTINFEIPYSTEVESLKSGYLTSEENASVELTFSSPTAGHSITVTLSHVAISEVDANVGGTGILSSTVAGEALSVGTDEPITIVITDKISTPYGG
jgi:hypothetical protein